MANDEELVDNEILLADVLIFEKLSCGSQFYKYLACHKKSLIELKIPTTLLRNSARTIIDSPYGVVISCRLVEGKLLGEYCVNSIKKIVRLSKTTEISIGYDKELDRNFIMCNALTIGCFTYKNVEYNSPAVFNDFLGIIIDCPVKRLFPQKEIGRLSLSAVSKKVNDVWQLEAIKLHSFQKVYSLAMSAQLKTDEHYGLVTREECDENRDLRLVSSRDFSRDVRIFRRPNHCCEMQMDATVKNVHEHKKCVDAGVGDVQLLGKSVALKMKRCHGMINITNNTINNNNNNMGSLESADSHHVDGKSLRSDVTQLSVNVHGGFVEVETICEYSGLTDHSGLPLLWSHDVEFVVDFSKIFDGRTFGLYIVKVVRFHRSNVFAKWRLARRCPIQKSLQTQFHSKLAHSLSFAMLGNEESSRFGAVQESSSLPRTDALDEVELFDVIVGSEYLEEDDRKMWEHQVLKIVEEP